MKLLEIHKKGINTHNKEVSYYGLDYTTKKVLFEVEELNEAIEQAVSFGYQKWAEITMMF
jgi:hypothetical protein